MMSKQTSAKQTNAQTQARQPNEDWSKVQADVRHPSSRSRLSSDGNNAKSNIYLKKMNDLGRSQTPPFT